MELIKNNPYRIAGILSNATAKEIEKQRGKIRAFAKIGKEITSDYDFKILDDITRTEDSIDKAFANIQQGQDKIDFALFWFLNASPYDQIAIDYLKVGNSEKAIEKWEQVTVNKDVNSKNFSAFNNLATFKLLSQFQNDIKEGIEAKIKLIESDFFENFVHSVAGTAIIIEREKQIEKLVDELLNQFKKQYSSSETLQLFSNCNGSTQKYLSKKFTEEPIHNIESQVESTKKKRNQNKSEAYEFGLRLFKNTKNDLSILKSLLGLNDLKYKTIADQLANEIMQCGIDYFNESQKNDSSDNYLESANQLTKLADSIAVGKLTKDRAKDSLSTLEEMKDQVINQAIALLDSIKLAYNKACSEIDKQVDELLFFTMPGIFEGAIPIKTPRHNVSINWNKVEKMKASCLNWDKIVEVIGNGIKVKDIATIQRCTNQSKVSEYKSLVDFLFGKLGPLQINQLKYICFWKDVKAAQVKSIANQGSSIVKSATGGGCYIATMAYGDYDHPQVMELRKFRDDFLSKTAVGRSFIKFYYRYSPSLVEKLKNKQCINLIIRKGLDQFIKAIKR